MGTLNSPSCFLVPAGLKLPLWCCGDFISGCSIDLFNLTRLHVVLHLLLLLSDCSEKDLILNKWSNIKRCEDKTAYFHLVRFLCPCSIENKNFHTASFNETSNDKYLIKTNQSSEMFFSSLNHVTSWPLRFIWGPVRGARPPCGKIQGTVCLWLCCWCVLSPTSLVSGSNQLLMSLPADSMMGKSRTSPAQKHAHVHQSHFKSDLLLMFKYKSDNNEI